MKTLFKVLVGFVVIVAIVITVAVMNLGSGIKAAIEEVGPEIVQADVSLQDVELSLSTGEGSLKGLVIGNPAGFKAASAFSLGEIALAVQPESLTANTIVINSIKIMAPEITYESGKSGSNIDQLQKNVESAVNKFAGNASDTESTTDEPASKKLVIKDFLISNGQVRYSNPLLGAKTVDVALPTIHLTGIGEKSGGATAAEVVELVLTAINKKAVGAISQSGLIEDATKGAIEQGKEKLEKKLGGLKGLLNK